MTGTRPALWLLAGPNGVGKTTYAFRHISAVSGSVHFVNLDEIARGLSPLAPDAARLAAARVAVARTGDLIRHGQSFSIETTLAGQGHLRTVAAAHRADYRVNLLFFAVASVEVCASRIARRVAEGGHDVPPADLARRFVRGIANFATFARVVDLWRVMNNNGPRPITAAEGRAGCVAVAAAVDGLPAGLAREIGAFPPCAEGVEGVPGR